MRAVGKRVTVTLRAVDARSGVQGVEAFFWEPDGNSGRSSTLQRVAGTRRNGVWRGVHMVARCIAQAGALRLTVDVTDGSGNTRTYRRTALAANGWPSRVAVRADDHSRPSAFATSDSVRRTGPIRIEFSEHVNGITANSIVVRRLFGNDLDFTNGPVVPGTWACRDGSKALANCETGRVLTAGFTPTQPLLASAFYSVTPNPEFSLGVTDLAGNPVPREQILVQAAP